MALTLLALLFSLGIQRVGLHAESAQVLASVAAAASSEEPVAPGAELSSESPAKKRRAALDIPQADAVEAHPEPRLVAAPSHPRFRPTSLSPPPGGDPQRQLHRGQAPPASIS